MENGKMALQMTELRTIVAIARRGSFGAAAAELNLSQPALSRRIAQVEGALGVALFERLPRGVRPTEVGAAFLRHAESALASLEDAEQAVRDFKAPDAGRVTLAFPESLCRPMLLSTLRRFQAERPGVTLDFWSGAASNDISEAVQSGRATIGLRYRADPSRQVQSVRLTEETIKIVCSANHRLARVRHLTAELLAREVWIGFLSEHTAFSAALANHGLESLQIITLTGTAARRRMIEAGFGIGLMALSDIEDRLEAGFLVEIQWPYEMAVPVYLIHRRGAMLSGAAHHLSELIQECFV